MIVSTSSLFDGLDDFEAVLQMERRITRAAQQNRLKVKLKPKRVCGTMQELTTTLIIPDALATLASLLQALQALRAAEQRP